MWKRHSNPNPGRLRVIAGLILVLLTAGPVPAEPVAYDLIAGQSRVGFVWSMGPDRVRGIMPIAGAEVMIDFEKVSNSAVRVNIDVSRARAGFPFADQAMKGPKVLWAERFPIIAFRSTRVQPLGEGRAVVEGDLTIRGVTRRVALDATVFRPPGSAAGDRSNLTIQLTTTVSRSAFGANGWSDMVGDAVRLEILAGIRARG